MLRSGTRKIHHKKLDSMSHKRNQRFSHIALLPISELHYTSGRLLPLLERNIVLKNFKKIDDVLKETLKFKRSPMEKKKTSSLNLRTKQKLDDVIQEKGSLR